VVAHAIARPDQVAARQRDQQRSAQLARQESPRYLVELARGQLRDPRLVGDQREAAAGARPSIS
jgi:hypothetical protein